MDKEIRKKYEDLFEDYFETIRKEENKYNKMYLINELLSRQFVLEAEGNSFWTREYLITQLSKCI
jgi:hypothetical protein